MRSLACAFVSVIALTAAAPEARAQDAAPEPAKPTQVAISTPPAPLAAGPSDPSSEAPAARRHRQFNPENGDEEGDQGPGFKEWLRLHAGPILIEPVALMQVQAI